MRYRWVFVCVLIGLVVCASVGSGADLSAKASSIHPSWSLSVGLFGATTSAALGYRITDEWEVQGAIRGALENTNLQFAGGDARYSRKVSGYEFETTFAVIREAYRSAAVRLRLGSEVGYARSDWEARTHATAAFDPGVLEIQRFELWGTASAEVALFKSLSVITSVRTPSIAHEDKETTGLFAQLFDGSESVVEQTRGSSSFRPIFSLRVRF